MYIFISIQDRFRIDLSLYPVSTLIAGLRSTEIWMAVRGVFVRFVCN
jgi:hypothetical protein